MPLSNSAYSLLPHGTNGNLIILTVVESSFLNTIYFFFPSIKSGSSACLPAATRFLYLLTARQTRTRQHFGNLLHSTPCSRRGAEMRKLTSGEEKKKGRKKKEENRSCNVSEFFFSHTHKKKQKNIQTIGKETLLLLREGEGEVLYPRLLYTDSNTSI